MKKKIIRIMAAAVGILLLPGCSNDGGMGTGIDAGIITIDATIGQMTKVSYSGSSSSFTENDTFLIYGWTGSSTEVPQERVVDSVTCSFDGTSWTTAKPMFWKNVTDAHYFLGIYPVPDSLPSFTAAPYKLDPSDYTASDLLIATSLSGVKATAGQVMLNFDHVMAKLNVNLKFRSEYSSSTVVTSVTVSAKSEATVNYLTKSVTATGTASEVPLYLQSTPLTGYSQSFSGILVPQAIRRITVTIGNKIYIYDSPSDITLKSGKYTNLGLIIGKDKIELASLSVSDWKTGTSLADAEAELFVDPYNGHEYVDMGLSVKWATCNVGATTKDGCGDYFAWGETETYYKSLDPLIWKDGKDYGYGWNSYSLANGFSNQLIRYCLAEHKDRWSNTYAENPDDKSEFKDYDYVDDAARAKWGGSWRTPTKAEWDELLNKDNSTCYWKTTDDGYAHPGCLVVSKINGNSIFLPAAGSLENTNEIYRFDVLGFYWTATLYSYYSERALNLMFSSGLKGLSQFDTFDNQRIFGFSVRPVCP